MDHIGYYEVPLGESRTIHEGRWVDGTDAIVDDVQGVFFASKRSITGEILVKVQYEIRFMNVVGTHCGRMRYDHCHPRESPPTAATS